MVEKDRKRGGQGGWRKGGWVAEGRKGDGGQGG